MVSQVKGNAGLISVQRHIFLNKTFKDLGLNLTVPVNLTSKFTGKQRGYLFKHLYPLNIAFTVVVVVVVILLLFLLLSITGVEYSVGKKNGEKS